MKNFYNEKEDIIFNMSNLRLMELVNSAIINKKEDHVQEFIDKLNKRGFKPDPIIELEGMSVPFSDDDYVVRNDNGSDIYHAYLIPSSGIVPIIEIAEKECPSLYMP